MQSSNHIGKIVRQHAEAVESGKSAPRKHKSSARKSASFLSVPKHRAFVPMVTIWGGLLLALMIAVLPDQPIARVSSLTGIYLPLLITRIILAAGIGLAGALLGYIVASALSHRTKLMDGEGGLVFTLKSRDVQPINPVSDLGSESLDAPFEETPSHGLAEPAEFPEADDTSPAFETAGEWVGERVGERVGDQAGQREPKLGELAQRGYDIPAPEDFEGEASRAAKGEWAFTRKHFKDALIESCEGATCEAAQTPDAVHVSDTLANLRNPKPRALDLSEFASLPERNGVWVEGETAKPVPRQKPEAAPSPAPEHAYTSAPKQSENALEKLRQKPAENLSLVEMVERFAGALHEHQTQERARAVEGEAAREAALAEALKALALFTQRGFDQGTRARSNDNVIGQTEQELRSALARLHDLRGAA